MLRIFFPRIYDYERAALIYPFWDSLRILLRDVVEVIGMRMRPIQCFAMMANR